MHGGTVAAEEWSVGLERLPGRGLSLGKLFQPHTAGTVLSKLALLARGYLQALHTLFVLQALRETRLLPGHSKHTKSLHGVTIGRMVGPKTVKMLPFLCLGDSGCAQGCFNCPSRP